jgi:uncharacterized membrane protein
MDEPSLILRTLILILSLAGLLDALYFTLAYYGHVKKARWVPQALCASEGSNCVAVVRTIYARVFGMPNSLLGIAYYLALIGWILVGGGQASAAGTAVWLHGARWLLVAASGVAVVLGFYLTHALWRVLRVHCPLCYAAHAINLALMALLILMDR